MNIDREMGGAFIILHKCYKASGVSNVTFVDKNFNTIMKINIVMHFNLLNGEKTLDSIRYKLSWVSLIVSHVSTFFNRDL